MSTIYLSSTYEDLKDHRRAVYEALRKSGHDVKAMEDYVAADTRPVEQCLKDVEAADIYVGIFAFRYGYIPPPTHNNPKHLSITELEYRHAETLKKPCLTFVVSDTTPWPPVFDDARSQVDKGQHINALRQHLLTEKLASQFSAPHELSTLVLAAVTKHLAENKQPESVKAKESGSPPAITWNIETEGSPYPGLDYFTKKYAPVFFGRDAEVRGILDRMRGPEGRFIIVSGDSGTGKSSVIHAGVLPKIEQEGLPDNKQALCVRMLPSQGGSPIAAFMGAMNYFATEAGLKPDDVTKELTHAPAQLGRYVQAILAKGTKCDALVLFLDQMEELFTAHTPRAAQEFLRALFKATQDSSLWVLATIRSDHLHHCHNHPDLLSVLRGLGHYPLGPIEPFMLEDLIAKPARCAGLTISNNLVRRIINESLIKADDLTKPDESSLPLLAFVLHELYEKRSNHELSEDAYNKVGGVVGAVAKHAAVVEAELQRSQGVKTDDLLPKVFKSLIIVNQAGLPTRRRPLATEFLAELRRVVEVLVQKRLLRTEGEGDHATISISHERLFEAWPSLKSYVDKNKKQLIDRTLLEGRAKKWVEEGRSWHSGLASAREHRDYFRGETVPTGEMKDYLLTSQRARWAFNFAIGIVASLLLGTTWLWQKGYNLDQAGLKVKSIFFSIHVDPEERRWMKKIDGGSFKQGDVEGLGESWRNPVHSVTIKPFAMGQYEVTFDEYDRFAIATGRRLPEDQGWGRGHGPVINVSWEDATAYTMWLSQATGKRYRLPRESEWEYAARSGSKQEVWAGSFEESQLGKYAVFSDNSQNRTAEVGGKEKNDFGLYDLSGNVWEWVEDCAHATYHGAPEDGSAWLEADGGNCGLRVVRGGSWNFEPGLLRVSYRNWHDAVSRHFGIGFRLAQDLEP